jgi:predicted NUDIX family phosphoesterase
MSVVSTEHVMVVRTELFREIGFFQGFCADTKQYLDQLLDESATSYLPRDKMEQDPSYKQLIPYCLFRYTDESGKQSVFQYTRGSGQGESRLHNKRSVGIGGHVSSLDRDDQSPYREGMRRELEEEVDIQTEYTESCVGLINDESNEVGQVHLGIVHILDVKSPNVTPREKDIAEAKFVPVEELLNQLEDFETWSQICLKALFQ